MDTICFFRHPLEILDHIPHRQGGTTVHRFAKCLVGQKRFITYQTVPLIYLKDNLTGKFFLAVEVSTEAKQEDWRSSYQYKIKRWSLKSTVYTWSITTNKASGCDEIPDELFQILKDDIVKVLHSICQQFGKLSSGHRTGKGQFSFQSWKRAMPKNVQTTMQLSSFCMLIRLCSKSCKLGFGSTWPENFQMDKLGLEKAEETKIKLPIFVGP